MAKYPVKPGIAIQLPGTRAAHAPKKSHVRRRPQLPLEEQNRILKKKLKRMQILWLVTILLLATAAYFTYEYFFGEPFLLPGQNYTTITDMTFTAP